MKTLKSLLLSFTFIFIVSQATAASNDNGGKSISKKIQSVLSTPKCLKNKSKSEKVTVCFSVNNNGDVTEVSAKTNNPEIKQYLEKQFLTLNLKGLEPCLTNTVNVNFVSY